MKIVLTGQVHEPALFFITATHFLISVWVRIFLRFSPLLARHIFALEHKNLDRKN